MAGRRDEMGAKESLASLGAHLRQLLTADPRAEDELRAGRAEFLEEVERRNAAANLRRASVIRRRRWWPVLLSASITVGAAAVWLWMRPLTFQIGGAPSGPRWGALETSQGGGVAP